MAANNNLLADKFKDFCLFLLIRSELEQFRTSYYDSGTKQINKEDPAWLAK
jgi:hypothetical protein